MILVAHSIIIIGQIQIVQARMIFEAPPYPEILSLCRAKTTREKHPRILIIVPCYFRPGAIFLAVWQCPNVLQVYQNEVVTRIVNLWHISIP
jgi:hypothetical protein